jgi:hypothetical protein
MSGNDDAATWRELADQLTPEQVAEVEYCERFDIPPGLATAEHLLNHARSLIGLNLAALFCADVPPPAHAAAVLAWERADGGFSRSYTVWRRQCGQVAVEVYGVQFDDGRIELHVLADQGGETMTAREARALAAALLDAAATVDRLSR